MNDINNYIDHTLLKPTAPLKDIDTLCKEAIEYNFKAVCVNNHYIPLTAKLLKNSSTLTASVIGFPLGANTTKVKVFEANEAINLGAHEIDMVINLGLLKSKKYRELELDISSVKKAIDKNCLKVIIETCYLTPEEIKTVSKIVINSGADYIKTSTGFGTGGAILENVRLIKSITKDHIKIKASGGIKNLSSVKKYLDLGVTRIGTSSGVEIMNEYKNQ